MASWLLDNDAIGMPVLGSALDGVLLRETDLIVVPAGVGIESKTFVTIEFALAVIFVLIVSLTLACKVSALIPCDPGRNDATATNRAILTMPAITVAAKEARAKCFNTLCLVK